MPLTYKIVKKILVDEGFEFDRQKGSHEQRYKNSFLATIPNKKEFPIGTAKSLIKQIATATNKNYKQIIKDYGIKL